MAQLEIGRDAVISETEPIGSPVQLEPWTPAMLSLKKEYKAKVSEQQHLPLPKRLGEEEERDIFDLFSDNPTTTKKMVKKRLGIPVPSSIRGIGRGKPLNGKYSELWS